MKIGLAMHKEASIACSIEEAQLFNGGSLAAFLTIIHADPNAVLDDHAMDLVNTADCQLMTRLAKLDFVAVRIGSVLLCQILCTCVHVKRIVLRTRVTGPASALCWPCCENQWGRLTSAHGET